MPTSARLRAVLLVPFVGVAGCVHAAAGRAADERGAEAASVVIVAEPRSDVIEDEGNSAGDAAARLVANDGRPSSRWTGGLWFGLGLGCDAHSPLGGARSPLVDNGVYSALDPLRQRLVWTRWSDLSARAVRLPMQLSDACTRQFVRATPQRIGRLAPQVARRDTSLLFTTERAGMAMPDDRGLLGSVIEQVLAPRESEGNARQGEARTAKPRAGTWPRVGGS